MGLMKLLLENCEFRMTMAPWSVRLQLPRIYYKADQCSGLASLVRLFYSAVIVTACLKNSPHPHKTKRRSAKIRRTWQASIIVVIRDVGDGWAGWTIAHPCFGRSVNPHYENKFTKTFKPTDILHIFTKFQFGVFFRDKSAKYQ